MRGKNMIQKVRLIPATRYSAARTDKTRPCFEYRKDLPRAEEDGNHQSPNIRDLAATELTADAGPDRDRGQ